jgi:hypothetical protein
MPFVGTKGAASYPTIRRVDLIGGEQYMREGRGYRAPSPAGAAGIGLSRTPGAGSPPSSFTSDSRHWLDETQRAPIHHWSGGGMVSLSSVNQYGFTSRSEMLFPELYKPIDTKFWQPLTQEQRCELVARTAAANARATFEDEAYRPVAATAADEQYAEAASRRAQAIRRRKKPRNYDERKKDEELKRQETLVRRYSGPSEAFYRDSSAIIKTGPLDTPILVSGLPVAGKAGADPAPRKLKARKPRRPRVGESQLNYDGEDTFVAPEGDLPTFSPLAGKKTKLIQYTNNPWGLKSWSELLYPEAYRDVSSIYWKKLSDEERQRIMAVQARAMEKVGYEPGSPKLFITPIEPVDDYKLGRGGRMDDTGGGQRGISGEGFFTALIALVVVAALLWYAGTALQGNDAVNVVAPQSSSDIVEGE